ncbi:hypothetical protein LWT39_22670, partial [Enterobacter hormaechei]|nr:hypothetical protein [Enterobacter hormaechei]
IITEQKELTNKTPQEATKNLAGMTLGELVLYQRYISEFQKSKSEKAIESMNKALNIINNTPEGLTLIDANKYPYDKKHTTNVGIIELTSRVMINSQKNLNNFLNNEIKKSDDFWNEIGNKYQRA